MSDDHGRNGVATDRLIVPLGFLLSTLLGGLGISIRSSIGG